MREDPDDFEVPDDIGHGRAGRKPTHIVKTYDPETGDRCMVGSAWEQRDGHLSIRLKPGVVLQNDRGYIITLWPNTPPPERQLPARVRAKGGRRRNETGLRKEDTY